MTLQYLNIMLFTEGLNTFVDVFTYLPKIKIF